jgi:hypothetical protein
MQCKPPHTVSLRSILILSTQWRLGLPSGFFPSGFPTNIHPHLCYIPCLFYSHWLDQYSYTCSRAQVMKLLIMQCSPTSYHFIPLRSQYSLEHPVIQIVRPSPWPFVTFRNKLVFFYGEELLGSRPSSELEDHPLSAVRDCFQVYLQLHSISGGCLLHPQPEDETRDPRNSKIRIAYSIRVLTYHFLFLTSGEIYISWSLHWECVCYFRIQMVVSGRNLFVRQHEQVQQVWSPRLSWLLRRWRQWGERHGSVAITAPYSQISSRTQANPIEVFRGFTEPFQTGIVP